MHWQYSWIFLPLKTFWAPTRGRAKKREFENNTHKHTAEGYLASPQTSVGIRLSRIHFSMRDNRTPTDVCGEAKGYWTEERIKCHSIPWYRSYVHSAGSRPWDKGRGERQRGGGEGTVSQKLFSVWSKNKSEGGGERGPRPPWAPPLDPLLVHTCIKGRM